MPGFRPVDSLKSPRFCGVRTFMRLPHRTSVEGADVAALGIPFDTGATYRVGSRFAPAAIRDMSSLLRPCHPVFGIDVFDYCSVIDYGDISVVPGYIELTYEKIADGMKDLFDADIVPLAMGGDHSVTLGELRAAAEKHGPVALLQLDSHSDTWDLYYGKKYTHGTPFRRAIEEGLLQTERSIQVGMRGPLFASTDYDSARDLGLELIDTVQMAEIGIDKTVERIKTRVQDAPVFFTFDIDFVDPAFAPGTGIPEVGGPSSREALSLIRGLTGIDFIGFDLVEVLPQCDSGDITSLLAANVLYEFLALIAVRRKEAT